MFAFTDEERATLTEFRAITRDERGREVLVGLTLEETAFYMAHVKQRRTLPNREAQKRYLELDKKHELARCRAGGG
jgi:hypothetical protein